MDNPRRQGDRDRLLLGVTITVLSLAMAAAVGFAWWSAAFGSGTSIAN